METQEYPQFYRGDTFRVAVWLRDTDPTLTLADDDPARGFNLSGGTISARVGNTTEGFATDLTVELFADQAANKGWVYVKATTTTAWPLGTMLLQLQLNVDGAVKTAQQFDFNVSERV